MGHPFRVAGWVATAVTLALYIVMMTVTLPYLADAAGGLTVFDLRPWGYDFGTAHQIVANLGAGGRAYYENLQHVLDAFYPPFLAFTVSFWLVMAAGRWRRRGLPLAGFVLNALIGFAFVSAICDLTENLLVSRMLGAGPDGLTPDLVLAASRFTLAKSVTGTIAYVALLLLAIGPFLAKKPVAGAK